MMTHHLGDRPGEARPDGTRDVRGIWIEQAEGAKFWLKAFDELETRGHFPSDEVAMNPFAVM